jgi:putative membrane protein insertion efficiency factor
MKKIAEIAARLLSYPLLGLVYFYRYAISPLKPPTCRHTPTCSEYMIQSLKIHGPIKGLWLGLRRLSSCHPWGTHGYDPVPPKGTKVFHFRKFNPK